MLILDCNLDAWGRVSDSGEEDQKLELSGLEVTVTLSRRIELLTPDP